MNTKIASIANKYLKLANYNIENKTFEFQLETHPDYPSIKSISDTFDYFGIENLIAKVPKEVLNQLPKSFIALFKKEDSLKLVLIEQIKNYIITTDENLNKEKLSISQFTHNWEGTIIAIEDNKIANKAFDKFHFKNTFLFIFCFIISINLILNYQINTFVYSLLSFIGLSISYFVIKEAFGIHNKTVAKFCERISKESGCSGVINSKKGKLFNLLSLSEASIVYFLINTITLITIGFNFSVFFCISVFSIPIVLYTIYYQGLVLKKWCALCLGISTILIIQFLVLLLNRNDFTIDFNFLLKYLVVIFIATIAFYFFKNLWIENAKLQLLEKEFLKFKRDKELFDTVLNKEVLINNKLIEKQHQITFGSENPLIIIDAVTNPLCGFCSESFKVYYNLLTSRNDVQINFIFSVPNDIKNTEMQIAITILNIYFKENKQKALEALKDWYFNREIDTWGNKYGLPTIISEEIFSVLKNQQNWLQVNGIRNIPATFIDNYYFPKAYNIEDLLMFIDDIILDKQN